MEKTTALYAYFGELGIFTENIPGHSFYQLGLLDSISEKYGIDQFDFINYLDAYSSSNDAAVFPEDNIGQVFKWHYDRLIDSYRLSMPETVARIREKRYSKLFLKARFRNLSTLTKKLKDAHWFEKLIEHALSAGYDPKDIVIVDTDLSLSPEFISKIEEMGISREIPSITIPGIGTKFATHCLEIHKVRGDKKFPIVLYYGNLDFSNYKEGHSKNSIAIDVIQATKTMKMFDGSEFSMKIAAKESQAIQSLACEPAELIPRQNREKIWNVFKESLVSINVSKDLYLEKGFTPARVYESIIFGTVPVSYKSGPHPAMSFDCVLDFEEICKFLKECTPSDYYRILETCAYSLIAKN